MLKTSDDSLLAGRKARDINNIFFQKAHDLTLDLSSVAYLHQSDLHRSQETQISKPFCTIRCEILLDFNLTNSRFVCIGYSLYLGFVG